MGGQHRTPAAPRARQRGAIAIVVGLSMVVLIGMAGLAIDGGRLYVSKTETQNAADACALAASLELTGAPNIPLSHFPIAESAGILVATRNNVGFQGHAVSASAVTVRFGTSLSSGSWVSAGAATQDARYVRCTIAEAGIAPVFMQILGFGNQTVQSLATATLAPSQNACTAIPVGICAPSTSPPYGLTPGQWLNATFGTGGNMTGNFGWLDYSPPNGGANEVRDLLRGTGACTVSVGSQVGQTGAQQTLRTAWNTRFGIYAPSEDASATGPVPDRTGYSYFTANWNWAVNGPALSNFLNVRRAANAPYGSNVANGNTITGLDVGPNGSTVLQAATLSTRGANRRIVPSPVIDCNGFASSQTVAVLDWGCVLMLHPISQGGGPQEVHIEYIGLASAANSPCASVGGVGNSTSSGPLVPALVQ